MNADNEKFCMNAAGVLILMTFFFKKDLVVTERTICIRIFFLCCANHNVLSLQNHTYCVFFLNYFIIYWYADADDYDARAVYFMICTSSIIFDIFFS